MHSHDFTELVVIFGGSSLHEVGGQMIPVSAGDVFVFKGEQSHAFHDAVEVDMLNLGFVPERLTLPLAELGSLPGYHALFMLEPRYRQEQNFSGRLHLSPEILTRFEPLIEEMQDEFEAQTLGHEAMLTGLLVRVMVWLSRQYQHGTTTPASTEILRMGAVMARLEKDYDQPLGLAELAGEAHMSVNNLLRVFRRATGTSPIDYLLSVRVNRAARLLRETSLPMTRIASLCGFCDSNYLSRQFRKIMGQTPTTYRRQYFIGTAPYSG